MNRDKQELCERLEKFIKAWKTGKTEFLDEIMIPDPFIIMSIMEPVYSREILKHRLKESLNGLKVKKLESGNIVCRVNGTYAQQSAAVSGEITDGVRETYRFCGMFVNHFEKRECSWMITEMYFDLLDDNIAECGFDEKNRYYCNERSDVDFARPQWNLINNEKAVYAGCRLPCIVGELQAPWMVITEDNGSADEREKIQELLYRYIFANDYRAPKLLAECFVKGAGIKANMIGEYAIEKGIGAVKNALQIAGGRGMHMVTEENIEIDDTGRFAIVKAKCESPAMYNEVIELTVTRLEDNIWKILCIKTLPIK